MFRRQFIPKQGQTIHMREAIGKKEKVQTNDGYWIRQTDGNGLVIPMFRRQFIPKQGQTIHSSETIGRKEIVRQTTDIASDH